MSPFAAAQAALWCSDVWERLMNPNASLKILAGDVFECRTTERTTT